jgi:hypothetical protein
LLFYTTGYTEKEEKEEEKIKMRAGKEERWGRAQREDA